MTWRIEQGDCLNLLPAIAEGSVDALCCDPPYHLTQASRNGSPRKNDPATPFGRTRLGEAGFMGKTWDGGDVAFRPETWAAVLRVVKPGGYGLVFGGTRTFHRLACALEDGGWVLVDTLCWLHSQGFPKGKGQLKPAWEPILLVRKRDRRVAPLPGLDACRIPAPGGLTSGGCAWKHTSHNTYAQDAYTKDNPAFLECSDPHPAGRWPANLVLSHLPECRLVGSKWVKSGPASYTRSVGATGAVYNAGCGDKPEGQSPTTYAADGMEEVEAWECVPDCPVRLLDEQAGPQKSGGTPPRRPPTSAKTKNAYGAFNGEENPNGIGRTTGNVSRFFYCAKASKKDRGEGNTHPTVKPVSRADGSAGLMRWLVRLITPPGGLVLDPFAGSGSTLLAAEQAGFNSIGFESNPEYCAIARRRLEESVLPLLRDCE